MVTKGSQRNIPIKEIAEKENISPKYLEQIFAVLKKAKLIKSVKGSNGGYQFVNSPDSITAGNVIRLLEGDLKIVLDDEKHRVDQLEYTLVNHLWKKIDNSISDLIDNITIYDLSKKYSELNTNMFYI